MVKRKAGVSVDEWLGEGGFPSRSSATAIVEAGGGSVTSNLPTAEREPPNPPTTVAKVIPGPVPAAKVIPGPTPTEPVAITSTNVAAYVMYPVEGVAISSDDAAEWLWALLAQAGHECC